MPDGKSRLVYSTSQAVPRKEKNGEKAPEASKNPERVLVRLERKGRGGKSVTVVEGLRMSGKLREETLKHLKGRLGTGGTVTDSGFEIQGDHCTAVMAVLETMGLQSKRSGG